jgi:hypothetical protein
LNDKNILYWTRPELREEIYRLRDEVERLNKFCTRTIIPNEVLQAEVERLTKENNDLRIQKSDASRN